MRTWLKHGVGILACSAAWGLLPLAMIYAVAWNTNLAPLAKWPLIITGWSILIPGQWLSDVIGFSGPVGWVICSFVWGILIWCVIVMVCRLSTRSSELSSSGAAGGRSA